MRTLSAEALESMHSQESSEIWLVLVEIDDTAAGTTKRYVYPNLESVDYGGETYEPRALTIALPEEGSDHPPVVQVSIDNVDQDLTDTIRLNETADARLAVIVHSTLNMEIGWLEFKLHNAKTDAYTMSADLYFATFLDEQYPAEMITPLNFPALYRSRMDDWAEPAPRPVPPTEPPPRGAPAYSPWRRRLMPLRGGT